MEQNQTFMKEKPIFKLLISMSVPVMFSMLIGSLYNIVDSIWVAKLGTDALTAVSLAFPLQNMIDVCRRRYGDRRRFCNLHEPWRRSWKRADQTASLGIALAGFHCILFLLAGIFFTKPFLSMFTNDPKILEWSRDYTYIVMCVSFGQLLQMCLEKIFQGIGKMKTTMYLMASGCIINIILDPILIFGWFGLPAMGVTGAAVATVIGQIGALLLYILVCLRTDIGVTIHPRYMKPDKQIITKIYSIGIPSSLMLTMPSLLTGILNGLLTKLGSVYVAVFGLYFKLQTFINMPSNGVVQGMRPIISYNYGAGEQERVKKTIRYSMGIVAVIMLIGTIGALVFPRPILQLFDADASLMAHGIPALRIIGLSFLISTVGIVASGVFEALGQGKKSLTLSLLRQLVIIVPVGWILSHWMGAAGIWIAFPIAELIASVVAVGMLRRDFS